METFFALRRPCELATIQGMEAYNPPIRPMEARDIRPLCGLLGARFLQDPKSGFEVAGLQEAEEALRLIAAAQLGHYLDWGEAYVFDDDSGVLLGHFSEEEDTQHSQRLGLAIAQRLRRALTPADIDRLLQNQNLLGNVQRHSWKRHVSGGSYYEIDLLCLAAAVKGTGALRRLLDPMLRRASALHLPVLLVTHNPANLPIYEHFGFSAARTYASNSAANVTQYCLIWRPE